MRGTVITCEGHEEYIQHLDGKPEQKRELGRSIHRWKETIRRGRDFVLG